MIQPITADLLQGRAAERELLAPLRMQIQIVQALLDQVSVAVSPCGSAARI